MDEAVKARGAGDTALGLLHPSVRGLLEDQGILEPTPPQEEAIPIVLEGRNVLLIAPTGYGKTEAAVLPVWSRFLEMVRERGQERPAGISILYITPLRALNRDMLRRLRAWGEAAGIDVAVRHGDTTQAERNRQSKNPPDMLITTPETLQILFTGKRLVTHLRTVRWVVVDEVHELSGDERGAQLMVGLERLEEVCAEADNGDGGEDGPAGKTSGAERGSFQRIGLSATVGMPEEVGRYLVGPGRDVTVVVPKLERRMDISVLSPGEEKEDMELGVTLSADPKVAASIRESVRLIREHDSVLFFVNTRDNAEGLSARMRALDPDLSLAVHHGSLSKLVRVEAEDDFKAGQVRALMCTSSMELGIDIGSVDFVVQYTSPRQACRLVQRVGRAGHAIGRVPAGCIIAMDPDDIAEALVVRERATRGEVEFFPGRVAPLTVLANQIAAQAQARKKVDAASFLALLRRSQPFRDLTTGEYRRVLEQLRESRIIWYDESDRSFGSRGRSRIYFHDNISMIPDEKKWKVVDITTRRPVGTLDEAFVTSHVEAGLRLIIKGQSWSVVDKGPEEILVQPASYIGAVPGWLGEEIPVPLEVALQVGELRRMVLEDMPRALGVYGGKRSPEEPGDHPNRAALEELRDHVAEHAKRFPVPSDRLVTVEREGNTMVMNACFGSRVNQTLGNILSALTAQRFGASVGIFTDPYRIILTLPGRLGAQIVMDMLRDLDPGELRPLLRLVVRNSSYMRWGLVHAAKKFGAIEKGADSGMFDGRRLVGYFEGTPIFEDALDKIITERMDIDGTARVLRGIRSGDIGIEACGLSPIGNLGLTTHRQLMIPAKADRSVLLALKRRIGSVDVKLLCMHCRHQHYFRAGEVPPGVECQVCGGKMLAALRRSDLRSRDLAGKDREKLRPAEVKALKRLLTNANLVMEHGGGAVLALMARGVGPDTAARILRRPHDDELGLLREILTAEVNYARTKRFWD